MHYLMILFHNFSELTAESCKKSHKTDWSPIQEFNHLFYNTVSPVKVI